MVLPLLWTFQAHRGLLPELFIETFPLITEDFNPKSIKSRENRKETLKSKTGHLSQIKVST